MQRLKYVLVWTWNKINWVAVVFSIIGIVLNANKMIECWAVWILGNTLWIVYAFRKKDWAYVVLWIVFSLFNFYGWYQWLHE